MFTQLPGPPDSVHPQKSVESRSYQPDPYLIFRVLTVFFGEIAQFLVFYNIFKSATTPNRPPPGMLPPQLGPYSNPRPSQPDLQC
jgi:hypothetical protein